MKATKHVKRAVALGLSALALSSVMLCGIACTRGDQNTSADTTDSATDKPSVTTPATDSNHGSNGDTAKPLDPDDGTVKPDGKPGDPPAGTEGGDTRSILPRFMK